MQVHHFSPLTKNVGDQFVQTGIARLVHTIDSKATIQLFDVNRSGENIEYGLTRSAIDKANRDADFIIVGGSNLYEGALGWPWGVHVDTTALGALRVPLLLVGIGVGSAFASKLHSPSRRAAAEIRLLNDVAALSWTRDVVSLGWLQTLGVTKAEMLGDPAAYIFNSALRTTSDGQHVLIVIPPARVWGSWRGYWKARRFGRPIFQALVELARHLVANGTKVVVVCNDPLDLVSASSLFNRLLTTPVVCPANQQEYFLLVKQSRAVISGRLHTAVVALSLGIPFLLLNIDQRTEGFIQTYRLGHAAIPWFEVREKLLKRSYDLLAFEEIDRWTNSIEIRDKLHSLSIDRLRNAMGFTR